MRQLAIVILLSALTSSGFAVTGETLTPAPALRAAAAASAAPANAQLPPEIMVDRHLLRAERLLAADDPAGALDAMNEILALKEQHEVLLPDDFDFQYAQVAYAAGRTETAIAALNEYLVAAGRAGEFYREALELLDSAELRLEREEAGRRRARRRAEAERRRAARWPPGHVFRDCDTCPEMVVLPRQRCSTRPLRGDASEQYRAFAAATGGGAATGCWSPSYIDGNNGERSWRNPGFPQTDRHPATCVSWGDAHAYASWLNRTGWRRLYRLPNPEADLDHAAAAGSQPGCNRWLPNRPRQRHVPGSVTYGRNAVRSCRTCSPTCPSGRRGLLPRRTAGAAVIARRLTGSASSDEPLALNAWRLAISPPTDRDAIASVSALRGCWSSRMPDPDPGPDRGSMGGFSGWVDGRDSAMRQLAAVVLLSATGVPGDVRDADASARGHSAAARDPGRPASAPSGTAPRGRRPL